MAEEQQQHGVYGVPPPDLAEVPRGAVQFSPLVPGASRLEDATGSLASLVMLAPPGTAERGHALALGLKALTEGGELTVMAPIRKGGSRLAAELEAFGLEAEAAPRRHHRIATVRKDRPLTGIEAAIEAGKPRIIPELGLWSQPGIFAFDRVDPATRQLIDTLPVVSGRGADFGCGIGVLARAVLTSPLVTSLLLVDIDRRAVECAEHNVVDPRAAFLWADVRTARDLPEGLDFIVMNPPFHDGGVEDRQLGQTFIRRAAQSLRRGGRLYLTANLHLPYEGVLTEAFAQVRPLGDGGSDGYKLVEAIR